MKKYSLSQLLQYLFQKAKSQLDCVMKESLGIILSKIEEPVKHPFKS